MMVTISRCGRVVRVDALMQLVVVGIPKVVPRVLVGPIEVQ